MTRDYEYVAVVYRKDDPWPIRHFCFMSDTPREREAFFKWYYKDGEYYQNEDDEVAFFDDYPAAKKFEEDLKKISEAG